jgi:regulator of sirC expression with transglutaminase-like and TPR domain
MSLSPVRDRFAQLARLPDDEIDLALAALLIAAEEYEGLDVDAYSARIDDLAAGARDRVGGARVEQNPRQLIDRYHTYLFEELGFRGNEDDYYDPKNSFLNDVLDRRTGIPISLAAVYVEVARRLGWPVRGVGFPGHFLAKWELDDGDVVVDPFFGTVVSEVDCKELLTRVSNGQIAFRRELLASLPTRGILARMLANLKGVWVKRSDFLRAISACDRILLLVPEAVIEYRDRGLLWGKLECHRPALADLERYLAQAPRAADARTVREQATNLREQIARLC